MMARWMLNGFYAERRDTAKGRVERCKVRTDKVKCGGCAVVCGIDPSMLWVRCRCSAQLKRHHGSTHCCGLPSLSHRLASGGTYNFLKILKSAMVFMAKLLSHSRHRRACACECEYSVVGVACGK